MIVPVGQKVALEIITNLDRFADDLKKRSGLLMPKFVEGTPDTGRVYAIAPDIKNPEYNIGDIVVFQLDLNEVFTGVHVDDKKLVFVRDDQIIAKLEEEL